MFGGAAASTLLNLYSILSVSLVPYSLLSLVVACHLLSNGCCLSLLFFSPPFILKMLELCICTLVIVAELSWVRRVWPSKGVVKLYINSSTLLHLSSTFGARLQTTVAVGKDLVKVPSIW